MPNSAITAKAKAVSGALLTKDDYQSLIQKNSIAAEVAYLKQKPRYSAVFADTDVINIRRKQAEALINRVVFDDYIRLCKFAPGGKDGIMSFYIKELEAGILSKALIAVSAGAQESFVAALPSYITKYLCFDPLALAEAKNFAALKNLIGGTPYHKYLAPLLTDDKPDINALVTTVDCCYIKWAFDRIDKTAKGKDRERLKTFFLKKADADNLLMCYRLVNAFSADTEEIRKLLLPYHYRLKPKEIETAARSTDPIAAMRALFINKKLADADKLISGTAPEIAVNAADHRFFRHSLALSTNETEALYSLVMLFEIESVNLCRITEGIRYSLPPEKTEQYLIY